VISFGRFTTRISIRELIWGCCVFVLAVASGCMSANRFQDRRGDLTSPYRSVVASPLSTQLLDSAQLAAVNSIRIEAPSLNKLGTPVSLTSDEAGVIIERIARETMTLKVIGASRGAKTTPMSADAVLRTEILRFDERQGSALGGEPAVISFRMILETAGRRSPIWSAQYFLKQEAVSENLLRIGERVGASGLGAGWRSASEVFEKGVSAALTDFNSQREGQFLAR
jgi:hypothetical protein